MAVVGSGNGALTGSPAIFSRACHMDAIGVAGEIGVMIFFRTTNLVEFILAAGIVTETLPLPCFFFTIPLFLSDTDVH